MRFAAYVGASTVAAATVLFRAFHERPNFYSACVYLGQSNACRMILLNMFLLSAGASVYGLQRLLYGPLRAIEIEQLWDKAWYAITETALAMTTFRDEVGGWFFVMFMSLLAGKVWGWIGEGRVETLEQQPPANPKLFHARLLTSLLLSEAFDILMLRYCVRTLLDDARPGMMVMFAFEFAVLAIASTSTTARYGLTLQEKAIIKRQTKAKVEERREELRAARRETQQNGPGQSGSISADASNQHREDEVDENEIDVPGWQEKGRYILFLDLTTDFLKLILYMGFFTILLFFSGIPIHMFRDLFVTARSFLKRINDYLKYRNATRDMNSRYPDATSEELQRDGTCIICREEMRPWRQPEARPGGHGPRSPPDERQRPKKLPCGHILHFGCLRSWLERQQVCPTCRRSVFAPNPSREAPGTNGQGNQNQAAALGQDQGGNHAAQPQNGHQNNREPRGIRGRTFNLPGIRLTFATGTNQQFRDLMQQRRNQGGQGNFRSETQRIRDSLESIMEGRGRDNSNSNNQDSLSDQIQGMERQIVQEINNLNVAQEQLTRVRALQGELARLRIANANGGNSANNLQPSQSQQPLPPNWSFGHPQFGTLLPHFQPVPPIYNYQQILASVPQHGPIGSGHTDLPNDLTLPDGWSLLPLQRIPAEQQQLFDGRVDDNANPLGVVEQASLPSSEEHHAHSSEPRHMSSAPQDPTSIQDTAPHFTATDPVHSVPIQQFSFPQQNNIIHGSASTMDQPAQTQRSSNQPTSNTPQPSTIPNWSRGPSGPSEMNGQSTAQAHDLHKAKLDSAETEEVLATREEDTGLGITNGTAALGGSIERDKGKGRAATVEDSDEVT